MNETDTVITQEQLLLFELSMSIGQSLDARATCHDFLEALVARRKLTSASIWWLEAGNTNAQVPELRLLACIPCSAECVDSLPLTHPVWQLVRDGNIKVFTARDSEFESLVGNGIWHNGACILLPLGDQGVLILDTPAPAGFTPQLLDQLRGILARLTSAIQGSMAFARLHQTEAELRDANRHLSETLERSEQYAFQLAHASSHLQTLIHSLPDLVWLKDPDGVYLACNNRFEQFFGTLERDIVGKTDYDFVDKELADFFRMQDKVAMANGRPTINEEWITFASDVHRELLETTKTPIFNADCKLIGVLGIGHDVTERKQIEEALRATEERSRQLASMLRLMCDNVPDMIWAKDLDKRYLFANKAICDQLLNAHSIKEPLGKTDMFFAKRERESHPDNPLWHTFGELCQDSDAIALERGEPSVFEEFGNIKGKYVCLEVHKSPFFNERGEIIGTVGSARDITDRKRIEAELEQHRQHLEELVQKRTEALSETEAKASHILQSAADGLYGVDIDGIITFINPAACRILGYAANEVIGKSAHRLFHHSRADGTAYPSDECPGHHALRGGNEMRSSNEVYWHADGHAIPIMYAIHPSFQNGKSNGAVVSFVDITEQRAAAQAREQALIAAEHLARVKSEFLANMSHEIRTPLNGVLGFAQIGYRSFQDSEKTLNAFEKILSSGNRLLEVINDVLDFSKIDAGRLTITQSEVIIDEVIEQALELVRDRARAKRLDLKVDKAPNLPKTCISDPLRIGQILFNLLTNAVKFTETGEITLAASRDDTHLLFRITDTGIGISSEQLSLLFNPFQQIDSSSTRRFDGTGLGLAISKRLLELMNGDIRVDSRPGVGSTFEFRLPYIHPDTEAGAISTTASNTRLMFPNKPLGGVSILVAEDDPISQMVLEHNLTEDGASVVMVSNGQDAVERIIKDGAHAYDLVLMDVQMPEMDGYEATQRILELAPDLPIVGQTAHAFGDEREKCFAAGMVGHIPKPIDPEMLVKIVLQLI